MDLFWTQCSYVRVTLILTHDLILGLDLDILKVFVGQGFFQKIETVAYRRTQPDATERIITPLEYMFHLRRVRSLKFT